MNNVCLSFLARSRPIALYLLFILTGCSSEISIYECVTDEDLIERWLEVSSVSSLDNCYLLSSDGLMIEKNQDTVLGISFWEVIERDDHCIYEVTLDGEYVEIIEKESGCIVVDYQSQEATLCDCQY